MATANDELLTVNEIAERWKCTRTKVYLAIEFGKLKAFNSNPLPTGRRRFFRIRMSDLLTWEESRTEGHAW